MENLREETTEKIEEVKRKEQEPFWVFGYGSLCWNPGFEYQQSVTGYIKGFSRRFWQGNTTHRGTEMKPGRVATLIEDKEGITWGKAFLVAAGDNAALPYLSTREVTLGGYRTYNVNFHPRPSLFQPGSYSNTLSMPGKKDALLYIAVPGNRHWLGSAPLPDIAKQILECRGSSGPNAEYLLRLADFMRQEVPEALDEHLFSLERLVRKFAADMKVCLKTVMGEVAMEVSQREERAESSEPKAVPSPSFQFASRVPEKKLRCVNM